MVAPMTSSPSAFDTGMLSPVIIDSSTEDRPRVTTPSRGILSPGLTRMTSPALTSSTGTEIHSPSRRTEAVCGWSPASIRMAADIRPLARASSERPKRTRVMMTADVSKYTSGWTPIPGKADGKSAAATL